MVMRRAALASMYAAGFVLLESLEGVARGFGAIGVRGVVRAGDVQEDDGEAGGGGEGGDAGPHRAGADDPDFGDTHPAR